jgi:hypothetical protein
MGRVFQACDLLESYDGAVITLQQRHDAEQHLIEVDFQGTEANVLSL